MKNIILTMALLVTPTVVFAGKTEDKCIEQATLIHTIVKGRDSGITKWEMISIMIKNDVETALAYPLVELIYDTARYLSPEEIANKFLEVCLSEV
jgi:hypothetical protein